MISIDKFSNVIENAPLVSIDFIIEKKRRFLLGKRINRPAKDFWFTLGGRIFKNEKITDAIKRISKKEFNLEVTEEALEFLGVYEHFYADSFVDQDISTHYVVLAYKFNVNCELELVEKEHSAYNYFSKEELLENNYVHTYVKDYFRS